MLNGMVDVRDGLPREWKSTEDENIQADLDTKSIAISFQFVERRNLNRDQSSAE